MASIKNLKRGQLLYKVTKSKMGNTTMNTAKVVTIEVMEVHLDKDFAFIKNAFGTTLQFNSHRLKEWKVKKPVLKEMFTGQHVEVKTPKVVALKPKFKKGQEVEYKSALEEDTWDEVTIEEVEVRDDKVMYRFNGEMSSGQAPEDCFRKIS